MVVWCFCPSACFQKTEYPKAFQHVKRGGSWIKRIPLLQKWRCAPANSWIAPKLRRVRTFGCRPSTPFLCPRRLRNLLCRARLKTKGSTTKDKQAFCRKGLESIGYLNLARHHTNMQLDGRSLYGGPAPPPTEQRKQQAQGRRRQFAPVMNMVVPWR